MQCFGSSYPPTVTPSSNTACGAERGAEITNVSQCTLNQSQMSGNIKLSHVGGVKNGTLQPSQLLYFRAHKCYVVQQKCAIEMLLRSPIVLPQPKRAYMYIRKRKQTWGYKMQHCVQKTRIFDVISLLLPTTVDSCWVFQSILNKSTVYRS